MEQLDILMGEYKLGQDQTVLKTIGVGSCIVVILYDAAKKNGGMAHAMLSATKANAAQIEKHPHRYIEIVIDDLLKEMEQLGSKKEDIESWIIGGAKMFALYNNPEKSIGTTNINAAKEKMAAVGIPIKNEDTGGTLGRSVSFNIATGLCEVTTKMS